MRKFLAALSFGVALAAGAAFADTVSNGFGNTFVVTTAQGAEVLYHFDEGGAYRMTAPDGTVVSGTWTVANGQLCLTPQGGAAGCSAYVGDKNVGDTWTQTASDGSTITVTLRAGR